MRKFILGSIASALLVIASSSAFAAGACFDLFTQREAPVAEAGLALQRGELDSWETRPLPGQAEAYQRTSIKPSTDAQYPFTFTDGQRTIRLVRFLGEGKRGVVYLTEDGRALKLLKQIDRPRELLTQVWANRMWSREGVDVPQIDFVDPTGNYIIQEYIPGASILAEFSDASVEPPKRLLKELRTIRKAAAKIASTHQLYFDIKGSNFVRTADGRLVFVDCGPRFDDNRKIYTELPNGKPLPESLFVESFFYRQVRDEALREAMRVEEAELDSPTPAERWNKLSLRSDRPSDAGRKFSQAFSFSFGEKRIGEHADLLAGVWNRADLDWVNSRLAEWRDGKAPSSEVARDYKNVRGRLKRLRFGFESYSATHDVPPRFNTLVKVMGKVRDEWRRDNTELAKQRLDALAELLTPASLDAIEKEIAGFKRDDRKGFATWINGMRSEIREAATAKRMTGKHFHEVRKSVGALLAVAEADFALKTSLRRYNALLFLRTLNYEMGQFHDTLIYADAATLAQYQTHDVAIPQNIRDMISELNAKFLSPETMRE